MSIEAHHTTTQRSLGPSIGRRLRKALLPLLVPLAIGACGAKTGLSTPDASSPLDGSVDAGIDGGIDSGTDAGMCVPRPHTLRQRGAQTLFVIDRSNSMNETLTGGMPSPFEPSRWELVQQALRGALAETGTDLEVGAEFYPRIIDPDEPTPVELACSVSTGIDLVPAFGNVDRLLSVFDNTAPGGGTPTALALREVRDFFRATEAPLPRFVVLATDGGPNCNPDTGIPPERCLCTGRPELCTGPIGAYNCIDEDRTLDVISQIFEELGVPVYVIGIDDPRRPDLADVLDRMAIAGGRPREAPFGPSFYSVRRPEDLSDALGTITANITRCVFSINPIPVGDAELEVLVGGRPTPQDPLRLEGWDWTDRSQGELSLFGRACMAASGGAEPVTVQSLCPEL